MATSLTSTVGQFSIVDGTVQEDAPNLMVTRGPLGPQGREPGQLAIAVELVGRSLGEEEIYTELLQAISDAYFRRPGSVTARLQDAIQEANALLVHANADLAQADRLVAGVTCVLHVPRDIYIGQAGPAVVYVAQKGAMQRFPESSPWLEQPLSAAPERLYPAPLGVHPTIHPNLFHATVQSGDIIVLGTTSLAATVSTRDVEKAVVYQAVDDALYNMARLCGETDTACMVIAIHPKGEPPQAAEPAPVEETPTEAPAPEPEAVLAAEMPPAPAPEEPPEEQWEELTEEPEEPEPLLAEEPPLFEEPIAEPEMPDTFAEDLARFESAAESEPARAPIPERRAPRRAARRGFSLLGLARGIGAGIRDFFGYVGLGFAVIAGAIAGLFRRPSPRKVAPQERPARERRARKPKVRRLWVLLAIAVPVIVAIAIVLSLVQDRARMQQYEGFLQQAQDKTAAVQSAATPPEKHVLLTEALALLAQARGINDKDPRTAQLEAQIQLTLDQVNGTVRLDAPTLLWEGAAGESTELKRLIISGSDVYLLDSRNNRVIRYVLSETGTALQPVQGSPILVSPGTVVGGNAVNGLLDEAWVTATGTRVSSGLLALTQDYRLLEYNSRRGLSALALTDTNRWSQPAVIGAYNGNLYVLDAAANQILRYTATPDGYGSPPEDRFALSQQRDLRGAIDMAIDGAIYVLFSGGRAEKYMLGEKQPFGLDGIAQPLQQTTAIFTDVDDEVRHVYIADPGAERVIQAAKDGKFVRQFRFREGAFFARISDLHVDEGAGRLYFIAGDALYVCALPR